MAFFSHGRDTIDLHDEIAALRKEIGALGRSMSKHGSAAWRDTSERTADLGSEIFERAAAALPVVRKQAHALEETIRDNPTRAAAIVGLAALTIAAAFLLSGSKR